MNRETVEGKFDQLKGKAKQSVGEAVGNSKLANSGAIDQVKGAGERHGATPRMPPAQLPTTPTPAARRKVTMSANG